MRKNKGWRVDVSNEEVVASGDVSRREFKGEPQSNRDNVPEWLVGVTFGGGSYEVVLASANAPKFTKNTAVTIRGLHITGWDKYYNEPRLRAEAITPTTAKVEA